jgi:predicted DCC family thiol-disulfide oxidoreductase YuxK
MDRSTDKSIIFFDGVCNLCNGFVDFVIKRDHKRRFLFASLQGDQARNLLDFKDDKEVQDMSTVILLDQGKVFKKTKAVIKIFSQLGKGWYILSRIMSVVPSSFSNLIYDFIAARRYRLLGKRDACRIPTEAEASLFL